MLELAILLFGIYLGIFWTLFMLKNKLLKRCWGYIADWDVSFRCKKHQGHDGKHYWTNLLREKYKIW